MPRAWLPAPRTNGTRNRCERLERLGSLAKLCAQRLAFLEIAAVNIEQTSQTSSAEIRARSVSCRFQTVARNARRQTSASIPSVGADQVISMRVCDLK